MNTISADIFQTPYVRAERPGFYGAELASASDARDGEEHHDEETHGMAGLRGRDRAARGCNRAAQTDAQGFTVDPDFEKRLQSQLLDAKPGDVVTIPAAKVSHEPQPQPRRTASR
ncbi:hypothetical protein AB5I41_08290 [Sphingomonas sp. MMS24-JH45]